MGASIFAVFGAPLVVTQWYQGPRPEHARSRAVPHPASDEGMCGVPPRAPGLVVRIGHPRVALAALSSVVALRNAPFMRA